MGSTITTEQNVSNNLGDIGSLIENKWEMEYVGVLLWIRFFGNMKGLFQSNSFSPIYYLKGSYQVIEDKLYLIAEEGWRTKNNFMLKSPPIPVQGEVIFRITEITSNDLKLDLIETKGNLVTLIKFHSKKVREGCQPISRHL